jgi:four helix bundle protein
MTHNFRELNIWKDSILIASSVYHLTSKLPSEEKFGLVSQINRSAVSVPSNIAEGSGRSTIKDFQNFLNISLGSSYELETQLILIEMIYAIKTEEIILKINELQRMLKGFKKSLDK